MKPVGRSKVAARKEAKEELEPVKTGKRKAAPNVQAKKAKKANKDPNKPKRPPSADFFVFLEEFRSTFKKDNPNVKGVAAVREAGGEKWKSLTAAEKTPYEAKAAKKKVEYGTFLNAYNNKQQESSNEVASEKSTSEVQDDEEEESVQDPPISNLPEPMKIVESSSESMTSDEDDHVLPISDEDEDIDNHMIDELFDDMDNMANKVLRNEEIVLIFEDLIKTLSRDSPYSLNVRALKHFDQVKKVWENLHFISLLVKGYFLPASMERFSIVSSNNLSKFLRFKIRSDPSFEDIYNYQDNASMIRNALSVLIGYWSNEDSIGLLLITFGSHFFDISEDASLSVVEGYNTLVRGESSAHSGVYSPIADIRQDESIKELASQLSKIPKAVTVCQHFLRTLQTDVLRHDDRGSYHRHAAESFWFSPTISKQLIKALKKSKPLVDVFRKHSRGSQLLRCVERITRIQADPMLDSILESHDRVKKMSGCLSVLFGYWSDPDFNILLGTLREAKYQTKKLDGLCMTGNDNVQIFKYLSGRLGDVEGLKNVLIDKYVINSKEYNHLLKKIRNLQWIEERKATGCEHIKLIYWPYVMSELNKRNSDYWSVIKAVVKNGEVILFERRNFIQANDGVVFEMKFMYNSV